MPKIQYVGSTKISDGLYIGDQFASKDIDTIVMNHITHIINCSAKQVHNHFQTYGIKYLSYAFNQSQKQIILDNSDKLINEIFDFIQEAKQQGESCLIHTQKGQSIAFIIFAAYFMKKYQWSLYKTFEFLDSRIQKVQLKGNYFRQLKLLQSRLIEKNIKLSNDWITKSDNLDDLILRNTYLNSIQNQMAQIYKMKPTDLNKKSIQLKKNKLSWKDERASMKSNQFKNDNKPTKIIESILKGSTLKVKQQQHQNQKLKKQSQSMEESKQVRQTFGNLKLSIKKKLIPTPPLIPKENPPKQRKAIQLINPFGNILRTGSQKKINQKIQKDILQQKNSLSKDLSQQQKNLSQEQEKIKNLNQNLNIKYIQSPLIKEKVEKKNKIVNQEKRILKSEISEKDQNKKSSQQQKGSYQYPPFMALFKNNTQKQIYKSKQILNKSLQPQQKQQKEIIKKPRFQTETTQEKKEQITKKLLKKMVLQKNKTTEQKQNLCFIPKDIIKNKESEIKNKSNSEYIQSKQKIQKGFLTLNLKNVSSQSHQSHTSHNSHQRYSEERQKNPYSKKTLLNNFVSEEESKKNLGQNKNIRGSSPLTKNNSNQKKEEQNKMNIQKIKASINLKNQARAPSPNVSNQYSVSLKQANNIINNIFSNSNYKPKWKF